MQGPAIKSIRVHPSGDICRLLSVSNTFNFVIVLDRTLPPNTLQFVNPDGTTHKTILFPAN